MNRTPTIILVEDDPGMERAIMRLLTAAGWRARSFPDAETAMQSGGLEEAGCLILDIELPGMSGLDFQSRLAVSGTHLPVVFITGQDRPVFRERAARAGGAYLTKPFPSALLLDAIRKNLEVA